MSALILVGCAHHQRNDSMSTGAGGPVSVSQSGQSSSYLGDQEQTFVKEATQGGLAEVQMGRLAAQKGQSQEVRQLGQKLVQDHSKANQELKLLAAQKNIQFGFNKVMPYQRKMAQLNQNIANEETNAYNGANQVIGSLGAFATSNQNNKLLDQFKSKSSLLDNLFSNETPFPVATTGTVGSLASPISAGGLAPMNLPTYQNG